MYFKDDVSAEIDLPTNSSYLKWLDKCSENGYTVEFCEEKVFDKICINIQVRETTASFNLTGLMQVGKSKQTFYFLYYLKNYFHDLTCYRSKWILCPVQDIFTKFLLWRRAKIHFFTM